MEQGRENIEERATSKEIRQLIRQAISEYQLRDVSNIREFINYRIGKPYTSGQLSGCFTNMCKSGELINENRGTYRIGPEFEKRKSYYERPKFVYAGHLPIENGHCQESGEGMGEKEGKSGDLNEKFSQVRKEVCKVLQEAAMASSEKISDVKLGEISENDFEFVRELKNLNQAINLFCGKYGI